MTGRGIDQILPHPSAPWLCESYVASALTYVDLAERAHGPIPHPVADAYLWGDALDELAQLRPDLRLINLETSVTTSDAYLSKGINYRMHPANIGCLTAAGIDCCVLANNHVLDWGAAGLRETLTTLDAAGITHVGAGGEAATAARPAFIEVAGKGRMIVLAFGVMSSGIPPDWAARPGTRESTGLSSSASATSSRSPLRCARSNARAMWSSPPFTGVATGAMRFRVNSRSLPAP